MKNCHFCAYDAHNSFFCNNCGKVLPPCWDNYFVALDVRVDLDIDLQVLKVNYYSKLAVLHPDKFSKADPKERDLAQEHSAYVNFAYKSLLNPFLRAEHMVKVLHPDVIEELMDNEFLMKMMDWREQIEEAGATYLPVLKNKLKHLETQMYADFKLALFEEDIAKSRNLLAKWRFIRRFITDLNTD